MAHDVDIHVGKRIRHKRWLAGLTQSELAEKLGVRFQQVQKYESGQNRISASRLFMCAQALNVPVSCFFEGIEAGEAAAEPDGGNCNRAMDDREATAFIRSLQNIPQEQRRRIFDLAHTLAS
ncbi:MAG: helix-turn-helix transcriptional regulator [Paracoccaceae bacterium]